jgi:hypothetical protein
MTQPMPMRMQLPAPGFPMVTRVVSSPLFPPDPPSVNLADYLRPELLRALTRVEGERLQQALTAASATQREEPVTWVVAQSHPFVPTMKIVRMFIAEDGVSVYSCAEGGAEGMRNLIPMHTVRFVEEGMPIDIFVDELNLAEQDGPDEPTEPDDGNQGPFVDGPGEGNQGNPALA